MILSTSFPSLADSLSSSTVTGLYFASSWCPDCTPITPALKKVYEEDQTKDKKFAVVYVSSDNSDEQMMESYNKDHGAWGCLPFNSAERNELKRKFGVCAGKEVRELGLAPDGRKFGIPTLILIDSKSEEILSFNGVDDVMNGKLLQKYGLV